MYRTRDRSAVRRGFAILCALLLPGAVLAQDAPAPPPAPATTLSQNKVEEIVVTGTRLAEPNMVAPSPTQVVSAEDIAISGRTDINDLLHTMPQVFNNSLGQDLGNYTSGLTTAGGVATVDLRGLGPQRTLVLVNGKRLGIGSPNVAIASPAPDIDQIPTPLIERVDVLTGGASAVYGSDAIAGVVNFILKKDFEGFQVDADYGFNWDDNNYSDVQQLVADFGVDPESGDVIDGRKYDFSVVFGSNTDDGRGNVTGFLGYHKQSAVPASHRDFGQCQLNKGFNVDDNGTPDDEDDDFEIPPSFAFCAGSSNSNYWGPRDSGTGEGATGTGLNQTYSALDNTWVLRGTEDTSPPASFNSQPYIYMSRDDERYNADFSAHYDINDWVKPYAEFSFMQDKTHQQVAPTALFRGSQVLTTDNNYRINCANAFMSQQQRDLLCDADSQALDAQRWADFLANGTPYDPVLAEVEIGRRNIEGGGREYDYNHSAYRAVLGFTGDFATAWSYDLYGQWYYVDFYQKNTKDVDLSKVENALVAQVDASGNPVCGAVAAPCTPYNPFNGNGVLQTDPFAGVTQAQLDYLYQVGTQAGNDQLGTIHVDFTGRLGEYGIKLPTANDGISVNVGYENRRENQVYQPDSAIESGLLSGTGGTSPPLDASLRVKEYFGEVRVPLVQEKPFVYELNVDAGYRHSDYSSNTGGVDTWMAQLQYAPVAGAQFRGSYNKAIRAPSIIELYNAPVVGRVQVGDDPCAPGETTGVASASLIACLNTLRGPNGEDPTQAQIDAFTAAYGDGVAPSQGGTNIIPQGTAGQLAQLQGGNPNLEAEEADTYSAGIVISPELLPNFHGSVDYWDIKGDKFVGPPAAPTLLLSRCIGDETTGAGSDLNSCNQIVRQYATYSLTGANFESGGWIKQTNINVAKVEISGIDLQADYLLDIGGMGSVDFAIYGSYMLNYDTKSSPDVATYDCTGLFGATCQTVNPDWRHTFMTTWRTPWDIDAVLTWRYIGPVDQDQNDCGQFHDSDGNCTYPTYGVEDTFNAHIGSQSYFDIAGTYNALEGKLQLRAGINNFLDNRPPVVTTEIISGGQANTYETYDMFGRQIFVAMTAKF